MIRRWGWLAGLVVAVVIATVFIVQSAARQDTLNVLNWDFYIGKNTLADFQRSHGITVNYAIYASNEDARDRLRAAPRQNDVVFPSDYMMDYLIRNDMLENLPPGGIPNANPNIIDGAALEEFHNRGWDKFCVPYLFGNTGFAVNRNLVEKSPSEVTWTWLASDEFQGKILVLDDARQVLGSVMIELRSNPNSTASEDLNKAVSLLLRLKPKILEFTADTGKERMMEGAAGVAFAWSGDSLQVAAARSNWSYGVPSFGGLKFQDGICIPKGAPHKEKAREFINFLLSPSAHLDIIQTTWYPTTNKAARELAPQRLRDALQAASGSGLKMYQLQDMNDSELRRFEDAWARVKSG